MNEQAINIASEAQQNAVTQAAKIVEPIAHETSEILARYEKMGFDRPAPDGEVQKAADAVVRLMGSDPKNNALLLLAATEIQYSASVTLKVFTFINDHGDNKARVAEIEAAEPGMMRAFKYGAGDNQTMEELIKISEGNLAGLDPQGREYVEKQVRELKGVSPEQIQMVGQAFAQNDHLAATQRLAALHQHSVGRAI